MQAAAPPSDELQRLEALYSYGVLDSDSEAEFDELTHLAASICNTPIALISLIDSDRQWFKSKVGLDACETSRDFAFCSHAIHSTDILEVPDATQDDRFADNPLVTGDPFIRFYAGAPLITPCGHAIGTLCVIGQQPRFLSKSQHTALASLSRAVITQLELRRNNMELERINQFRSDFISYISHELRTPLNAVITFADLLEEDFAKTDLPTDVTDKLSYIKYSGERILNTVNSVLELNRIEAGKMKVTAKPVRVDTFLEKIKAIAQALADKAGLTLSFNINSELPAVIDTDEDKLAQVAMNLISNAVKFSLTNGRVDVRIEYSDDSLVMTIKDQGVGISEDDQKRLFQRYQRVGETSRVQGTGLGLAICKGLIDLMKGSIVLTSELGKGTLVKITVPIITLDAQSVSTETTTSDTLAIADSKRILVVEDNAINQVVVETIFAKLGLSIELADSGEACLQRLENSEFDIVFMDIRLPGISGLETTAALRKTHPTLPIVALTADVIIDDPQFADVSIEHVLTKPIDQNHLIRVLNHYLR